MPLTKEETKLIKSIVDLYREDLITELKLKERRLINHCGQCSICGTFDGVLHIANNTWFICNRHKRVWMSQFVIPQYWEGGMRDLEYSKKLYTNQSCITANKSNGEETSGGEKINDKLKLENLQRGNFNNQKIDDEIDFDDLL